MGSWGTAVHHKVPILATAQFRDSARDHPVPSRRHAPLGTHWGPEDWHVGSLGWYSVPDKLMFQRYPVALSESLVGARVTPSQAQEHLSALRSPFCPAVSKREGPGPLPHCLSGLSLLKTSFSAAWFVYFLETLGLLDVDRARSLSRRTI